MFAWLWNSLFPVECCVCEKYGSHLCDDCFVYLADTSSYMRCFGCSGQTLLGKVCSSCQEQYTFSRVFISADYTLEYVYRMIWHLKYNGVPALAYECAQLMAQGITSHKVCELLAVSKVDLIPIPLHSSKLRLREYNQAGELARHLATMIPQAKVIEGMVKIKKTRSQTEYSYDERQKNVEGVFAWQGVRQSDVAWIIDDVITTGSTANEVAKVLKEAGYKEIYVLALARG